MYFIDCNNNVSKNLGTKADPFIDSSKVPDNSIAVISSGYQKNINLSKKKNVIILGNDCYIANPNITDIPPKNLTFGVSPSTRLAFVYLNGCVNVSICGVSVSSSHYVPTTEAPNIPRKGVTLNACTNCVFKNSELFSAKSTVGWTANDWVKNAQGMVISGGSGGNKILNCNIYNCGGIQLKGAGNLVDSNVIKNFPTDGMGIWANNNVVSNNWIEGSHRANLNHNDLIQSSNCSGWKLINNTFICYSDPNQPFISLDTQGCGFFDGWFSNILVQNNKVFIDHPIGIWFQGIKNSVISDNIVKLCGSKPLYRSRTPCIFIGNKKSGESSLNNIVRNNIAPHFEFTFAENSGNVQFGNYSSDIKKIIPSTPLNYVPSAILTKELVISNNDTENEDIEVIISENIAPEFDENDEHIYGNSCNGQPL